MIWNYLTRHVWKAGKTIWKVDVIIIFGDINQQKIILEYAFLLWPNLALKSYFRLVNNEMTQHTSAIWQWQVKTAALVRTLCNRLLPGLFFPYRKTLSMILMKVTIEIDILIIVYRLFSDYFPKAYLEVDLVCNIQNPLF